MNIGQFFINIGLKGQKKLGESLDSVKKGLGETASMSLEAKAALVGMMYALEQTFAASGRAGTSFTNFNALLGVSTKTLQQYQYAARQMGVTNEDVEASFRGIQSAMSRTLMGEGAPKGMARLAALTGGLTPDDIQKFQQHPDELMQRLQEYASKEKNTGLRNEVLKSFGMSDSMIAAMTRNAFNPAALKKAPIYSDREIASLDKANIAWSNLGQHIEMAIGKFNAKEGVRLVQQISQVVDQVLKLTLAFTRLADKLHFFEGLGKVFQGWGMIFNLLSGGVDNVTKAFGNPKAEKQLMSNVGDFFKTMPGTFAEMAKDLIGVKEPGVMSPKDRAAPNVSAMPGGNNTTHNVSVKQNLHFQHEGKNARETADSTKKAIQEYYRQSSAQGQGA